MTILGLDAVKRESLLIVLIARYRVKPGSVPFVLAELEAMKPLVQENEPGCKFYQVSRSTDDENLLLLYEHYVDDAALNAHRETPHFKSIIEEKIIPMLEKRERELYTLVIA
jgi:(4S)-4-hydroxy-5-phosphonooxypentane-2,3-dione isomerase